MTEGRGVSRHISHIPSAQICEPLVKGPWDHLPGLCTEHTGCGVLLPYISCGTHSQVESKRDCFCEVRSWGPCGKHSLPLDSLVFLLVLEYLEHGNATFSNSIRMKCYYCRQLKYKHKWYPWPRGVASLWTRWPYFMCIHGPFVKPRYESWKAYDLVV